MKLTNAIREVFVNDVMKQVPIKNKWDFRQIRDRSLEIAKAYLPEEIKTLIGIYPQFFRHDSVYTRDMGGNYVYIYAGQNYNEVDFSQLIKEYELHKAEMEVHNQMRKRIMEVANSVTTTNRLKEVLPELARFVPGDEKQAATKNLPITANTLFSDLKNLGWKEDQL